MESETCTCSHALECCPRRSSLKAHCSTRLLSFQRLRIQQASSTPKPSTFELQRILHEVKHKIPDPRPEEQSDLHCRHSKCKYRSYQERFLNIIHPQTKHSPRNKRKDKGPPPPTLMGRPTCQSLDMVVRHPGKLAVTAADWNLLRQYGFCKMQGAIMV